MVDAWRRRDGCGLEWVVAQAVGSGVTLEHSGRDAITVTHHNGDLLQPGILLWISNVACIDVSLLYRVIKGEGVQFLAYKRMVGLVGDGRNALAGIMVRVVVVG